MPAPTFLPAYFAALDSPDPLVAIELLAPDLEFAILGAADAGGEAKQASGGVDELRGFLDGRSVPGRTHHVHACTREGDVEVASGEAREADGTVVATFVATASLDADGRARRCLLARTPAVTL